MHFEKKSKLNKAASAHLPQCVYHNYISYQLNTQVSVFVSQLCIKRKQARAIKNTESSHL